MNTEAAAGAAAHRHRLNRAIEQLLGIASGILADGQLHDQEVTFLSTWLSAHSEVADQWPGSAVAKAVRDTLADGLITPAERDHLVTVLQALCGSEFALDGSATPLVTDLPIDDQVTVQLMNAGVCHTGEFLYGTRAAVERATLRAGGMPADTVTKRVEYLVVGTRVSPDWAHTTYGRKIQRAVALQDSGHAIEIISEQRWLKAL